jgi:serpin B
MSALGMPRAFDPGKADFSNFCNVPTYIDLMKQVAKIKLNEEGTEAAAVTVIGIEMSAMVPSEPQHVQFFANRPFLYVISEQSTGAIFFIGQYMGD